MHSSTDVGNAFAGAPERPLGTRGGAGEGPRLPGGIGAKVTLFAVLVMLAAIGPSGFSLTPNCDLTDRSYAVASENFGYEDTSFAYAWFLYRDVREVIRNYFADDPNDEYGCFYQPGRAGILMELNCYVKRVSDMVQLTVAINRIDSGSGLLKFEATAPFFRPEVVVAEFAKAFPESFQGKVVRRYTYGLPQQGFYLVNGLGLSLGNVHYAAFDLDNLHQDLSMTDDLPPGLLLDVERFQKTEKFEFASFLTIGLGTLVLEFTSPFIFDSTSERYVQNILAVSLPGVVAATAIGVDFILFRPRRLLKILSPLNDNL